MPGLDQRRTPGMNAQRLRSGGAPDREREPATVAQHSPRLRQRRGRVGHQHVAEPADRLRRRIRPRGPSARRRAPGTRRSRAPLSPAAAPHATMPGAKSVWISFPSAATQLGDAKADVAGAGRDLEDRRGPAGDRGRPPAPAIGSECFRRKSRASAQLPETRSQLARESARYWSRSAIAADPIAQPGGERIRPRRCALGLGLLGRGPSPRCPARSAAAPTNSRNSGSGRVGRELNSGWNCEAT